jgi:hypothetical protein
MFLPKLRPRHRFDDKEPPSPPDYAEAASWAALPEQPNNTAFTPEGIQASRDHAADVFFVHPTSYFGSESWNAPLDHEHANEVVDELVMPGQASVFNGVGRIFAPRYRQATFYVFLKANDSGRAALELAYSDVLRAFDHFIEHRNEGRPFFIASHSQGSCHAMRLLKERIEGTDLGRRMIAAYAIGFRFPLEQFENDYFTSIRPSSRATDTGCVIAWDTYADGHTPGQRGDRAEIWYGDGNAGGCWQRRAYRKPVSTNPIGWVSEPHRSVAESNIGAVHTVLDGEDAVRWNRFGGGKKIGLNAVGLSAPLPAEVSAELRSDGYLYTSWPKQPQFTRAVMPGGNLHNYDYDLFYMNIRENAEERLDAYLARNRERGSRVG